MISFQFFLKMTKLVRTVNFEDWVFWTSPFRIAESLDWENPPTERDWVDAGPCESLLTTMCLFNGKEYPQFRSIVMIVVNTEEMRQKLLKYEDWPPEKSVSPRTIFYIHTHDSSSWSNKYLDGRIPKGKLVEFKLGPSCEGFANWAIYDYKVKE
jgi:hypothetical protein